MLNFCYQTILEKSGWNLTCIPIKCSSVYQGSLKPLARVRPLTGLGLEFQLRECLSSILSGTFNLAKWPLSPFLCKFILAHGSQVAKIIKQQSWKSYKTTKAVRVAHGTSSLQGPEKWQNSSTVKQPLTAQIKGDVSPPTFQTRVALYSSSWKISHITVHSLNYFIWTTTY